MRYRPVQDMCSGVVASVTIILRGRLTLSSLLGGVLVSCGAAFLSDEDLLLLGFFLLPWCCEYDFPMFP